MHKRSRIIVHLPAYLVSSVRTSSLFGVSPGEPNKTYFPKPNLLSHFSVSANPISKTQNSLPLVSWTTVYLLCRLNSDFLSSRISPLTNLSNITHLPKFGLTSLPCLPTAPFLCGSRTIYVPFALQEWGQTIYVLVTDSPEPSTVSNIEQVFNQF